MSAAVFQPRRPGPRGAPFGHRACAGVRPRGMSRRPRVPPRCMYVSVEVRPRPRTREPGRDCRLPRECRRRDAGAPETIARVRVPMPADPMARTGTSLQDTHPHRRIGSRPRRTANWGGTCAAHRHERDARHVQERVAWTSADTRFARHQNGAGVQSAAGQGRRAPPPSSTRMRTHAHRSAPAAPRVPAPARWSCVRCCAAPARYAIDPLGAPPRGARRAHAEVSATETSDGWTLRLAADRQAPACR